MNFLNLVTDTIFDDDQEFRGISIAKINNAIQLNVTDGTTQIQISPTTVQVSSTRPSEDLDE